MVPKEIFGRLKAHSNEIQDSRERYDLLAWMVGQYVLADPKKFPKKPSIVLPRIRKRRRKSKPMSPETMKDSLIAFAQINNAIEEANHGSHA